MENSNLKAIQAIVHGRVQGVGFRYSTVIQARKLSLQGYVRNLADGTVEVVAEGKPEKLLVLIKWLKKGPSLSRVINVDFKNIPYVECYKGFNVEF